MRAHICEVGQCEDFNVSQAAMSKMKMQQSSGLASLLKDGYKHMSGKFLLASWRLSI